MSNNQFYTNEAHTKVFTADFRTRKVHELFFSDPNSAGNLEKADRLEVAGAGHEFFFTVTSNPISEGQALHILNRNNNIRARGLPWA